MRAPLLLLALLAGCGGGREAAPVGPPVPLDRSWVARVADTPARFSELVDPARDGWAAFHRCDFQAAADAFQGDEPVRRLARARAEWELSLYYDDLARTEALAWERVLSTWKERGGLPDGSALYALAGLSALDAGQAERARELFQQATGAQDPAVAEAARRLADVEAPSLDALQPFEGEDLPPLLQRVDAHLAARRSGDPAPLGRELDAPLVEEEVEEAGAGAGKKRVEHRFYDPLLLRTLSLVHRQRAADALGTDDPFQALTHPDDSLELAALLFGPVADLEDLRAEGERARSAPGSLGAGAPLLVDLGLPAGLGVEDDAERARAELRRLDAALDAWAADLHARASDDGRALLDQLALVAVFRSRILLALAREARDNGHPRQAATFAGLALDLESSRQLGPVNHPGLYALLVDAQVRTGHTREALDALEVLATAQPELTGLDELVGDLAILQGLDRLGDSKEN